MAISEEEQRVPTPKAHAVMLAVSFGSVGYLVLSKAALNAGVNVLVFCAYRDGIAFCTLAPLAFFAEMKFRSRCSVLVLGLILIIGVFGGFLEQVLFLVGLENTNTFFASAMQNCSPVFVLLIAATFRTEEVRFRQRDGQAKILGIIFCVLGALLMSIYKGPVIFKRLISETNPPSSMLPRSDLLMGDLIVGFEGWGIDKWALGGLCLILQTLSVGIETNLKGVIMARFPAPITVIAGMALTGFLLMVIICYYTVQEQSEWGFHHVSEFLAAAYGGLIITGINNVLKCWSVHNRGPIFVAAYAPVMPILASIFGTFILGESLFLGCVIGTTLILSGLFFVTWGQSVERKLKALSVGPTIPIFRALETPLLR
ncbi:hypothetical protein BDL97_08G024200 [Sphagnum fallax]|nr:hypothetical protein BDL97_08G024200 [Sphagnum fallax]KAH8953397.1 hypothetical protein BDL97_08G024200 [Sphagnum fallax]